MFKLNKLYDGLIYSILFFASFKLSADNDIGWHLKQGEYLFLNHKIMDINFLSTGMPNFHYINAYWLLDLFLYLVYKNLGFIGLAILASTLVVSIFYILTKSYNYLQKLIVLFIVIPASYFSVNFSILPQIVSVFLLALIFHLLQSWKNKQKLVTFISIILLMAAWPNLHGEFILGLILILILLFIQIIEVLNKKVEIAAVKKTLILFIAGAFSTVLNPYGLSIYDWVFAHSHNPALSHVAEWAPPLTLPFNFQATLLLIIAVNVFSFVVLFKKKRLDFEFLVSLVFLVSSFIAVRYLVLALFMSIPALLIAIKDLNFSDIKINKYIPFYFLLVILFFFAFIKFPYRSFVYADWKTYCLNKGCSENGAKYIINHNLTNNLFTVYDFGGWLIWEFPQIKPYTDGRMSVWADYTKNPPYSVFEQSYNLEAGGDIQKTDFKVAFILKTYPLYPELLKLTREGKWKKVFEDYSTAIFTRN